MMLPTIFRLRAQGALVRVYLDDFLVIQPLADCCRMPTQLLVDLRFRLRIQVQVTKSVLKPRKSLIFLGLWLDLARVRAKIPPTKLQSLIKDVNRLLHVDLPT